MAAVKALADLHRKATAVAENRNQIYESLLAGKTFEQWTEEVAAIESLPATRDLMTIDQEITTNRTRLAEGSAISDQSANAIEEWKRHFTDQDTLTERLLEARTAFKQAKDRLASLPGLPEQFASVKKFLEMLATAQQQQVDGQRQLTVEREKQARLTTELGDRRSEDIAEEAGAAKRTFERARGKGRDYLRIREELDRMVADGGADPLVDFSAKVAEIFTRITGQTTTFVFDGQLPVTVERGGIQMPHARLSQGASGALGAGGSPGDGGGLSLQWLGLHHARRPTGEPRQGPDGSSHRYPPRVFGAFAGDLLYVPPRAGRASRAVGEFAAGVSCWTLSPTASADNRPPVVKRFRCG